MSLPYGRSTLAQMMTTERNLTSDLKITIPGNLNETNITCANNHRAAVTKSFMLVTGKQAAVANRSVLIYISSLVHRLCA